MAKQTTKRVYGSVTYHSNRETFTARLPAFKKRAFELRMAELSEENGRPLGFGKFVEMLGDNDKKVAGLYKVAKQQLEEEKKQQPDE
ncbi:hypothetical protein [Rhodococcus pyridinivorans]|uniref:hypothetical protein n=1 Tax=Rhodococcus pyridinivorans TaxID=103816 RepID=UPI000A997D22|nr:hypothetical protein [Rhodococcus pyridinivorans]